MPDNILNETELAMEQAVESLEREFKRLRTGRATPTLVEHVLVDYYGSDTPLPQIANVSAPEPRLLVIKAYDNSVLPAIEKAIIRSDLGVTPQNDGKIIRLQIPPLNEETRKKLVQETKKLLENGKISVRNTRRDGNKALDQLEKDKAITEDDNNLYKDKIQDLTKKYEAKLDSVQEAKEKELLTV